MVKTKVQYARNTLLLIYIFVYGIRNGAPADEPYNSLHLNGNGNVGVGSRAPPWPVPRKVNEKMFLLPKQLEPHDTITINCETTSEPTRLTFGLVTGYDEPDSDNLACQLDMNFTESQNEDTSLQLTTVYQGNANVVFTDTAKSYFDDTNFEMKFILRTARDNGYVLDVHIGASYLSSVPLEHDVSSIKFITISGDIKKIAKLGFEFGYND
ncbi:hypothetical protein HW555_009624 [Spodoptera exigua]|uniref:Galectin domain-containing protein n=1 Tax=Spodoptera exigua TaxID=7107 RepID=A0A835GC13_SPOEX|nr:hypothetical protein HW555_009624 [Spodoptera exigua]